LAKKKNAGHHHETGERIKLVMNRITPRLKVKPLL